MLLKFICPMWGSEQLELKDFVEKVKRNGYDGVEFSMPMEGDAKEKARYLKREKLIYIAQHWETHHSDFKAHKKAYRQRLEHLASIEPYFINAHTGKDYFSFEQNNELIALASEVSEKTGITIIHETHRGRFNFAAHITRKFLEALPELKLTLDLSHWCNVAESYLEDQKTAVDMAIARAHHIHARVGFPEGPQVPDPRAEEWNEALEIHLNWWKKIVEYRKATKADVLTIAPEFGPFPYMQMIPHTKAPLANQWDINVFMKDYLKEMLQDAIN